MCEVCRERAGMWVGNADGGQVLCVACAIDDAMSWYEVQALYAREWNKLDRAIQEARTSK